MRFMLVCRPAVAPPAVLEQLVEEMARAGLLLATDGFRPLPMETRVRICAGEFEVLDEPVCESPTPGGYAIVQVSTRERAIELAKRFLAVVGEAAGEVRLLPA